MKCERCGSETRMQVQVLLSAPGECYHHLPKSKLRKKDTYIYAALWETADFICTNTDCRFVTNGFGNYVTNLKKEVDRLKEKCGED